MESGGFSHIVDVFKCCIFSWDFVPVVLPAFLIAGAVPVFISTRSILKHLGYKAKPVVAYAVSSLSGFVLSACSCNIVPLAKSIYERGAGMGPAFAFLYGGAAINFVSSAWVFSVVGFKMGLWRTIAAPVISTLTGLTMYFMFRREERQRRAKLEITEQAALAEERANPRHVFYLFALLMAILCIGGRGIHWYIRIPTLIAIGTILGWKLTEWFHVEDLGDWMRETGHLLKMVLPVLVPAILVIGYLQNNKVTWNWLYQQFYPLMGENGFWQSFHAAVFGSLMYFPLLTEVALTKALLKTQMIAVGPALAILLNGPGVSLPGAILVGKLFGWRKAVVYEALEIFFGTIAAWLFGKFYGQYQCPCQAGDLPTVFEDPTSLIAAVILSLSIAVVVCRARRIVFRSKETALPDE
ncbi:MAG: permease [Armatimonadetes bacterium]|nr:permease [Armatimonadota bacterium]